MRISCYVFFCAVLLTGVGCRSRPVSASNTPRVSEVSQAAGHEHGSVREAIVVTNIALPNMHYRVEVIPNQRLTPTSREGDKSQRVYSSNIIAIYAETNTANAETSHPALPPK